jgi:hypothetical protein
VARHVAVKVVEGEFEGRLDTQTFIGIPPGRTEQIRLNVRPRSAGSSVPLYIRLYYTCPDQQELERDISAEVPVHARDSRSITSESAIGQRKPIRLHRDKDYEDDDRREQTIVFQGDDITVGDAGDADVDLEVRDDLYQRLVRQFNVEEIRDLTFALGIDYEDLRGSGKSGIARELVLYMQRRNRLDDLNSAIQERRG